MALEIFTNQKNNAFKYDYEKLYSILPFFLYHNLKHIKKEQIPNILIEIDSPHFINEKDRGRVFVIKNKIIIHLSTKAIKKATDHKIDFPNYIKAFLYNLLHEISHALNLINKYFLLDKVLSFEKFYNKENKFIGQERKKKINKQGDDGLGGHSYCLEESNADWFAYKNLSLLENLYYTENIMNTHFDFFE